ncbi:Helix-turn-helix domain-containing protein [Paenibacillus sp. UNCCL117]|uniref:helix-turn-helix domain-containing protein n=1 Tax=unclassified Paenibacillus TaxID=185978 RepID=UPI00087EC2B1|nr:MULTISPECIES: helix-turn-helix domain-containing protein [unclassified Paenibacillus]SDC93177.1 Helix-turn-helix domain-containing protein [Paenibacillus sp. cl123]SFW29497.1 Helix-turn-helix domain-containing protein [Paenibacillus sp. UNCCL117]
MSFLSVYRSRKYLQRILLSISLLITLSLSLTALTLYQYSEKIVRETQYDANMKVLSQVNSNIGLLGKMIDTQAFNLFVDHDIISMLYGAQLDSFEQANKQYKLDKWVNSNTYIDSVILYNARTDGFYAGGSLDIQYETALMAQIRQYLSDSGAVSKAELVPMILKTAANPEHRVFSYILYESNTAYKPGSSALVINVKPDWVFDNIRRLNNIGTEQAGKLLVIGKDGSAFSGDLKPQELDPALARAIKENRGQEGGRPGLFSLDLEGERQLVTYMPTDAFRWTIVSLQPYDTIFGALTRWKTTTLALTAGFFLLSLVLSVLVSHRLYGPIRNLVRQIKVSGGVPGEDATAPKDDLDILSETYTRMLEIKEAAADSKMPETDLRLIRNYNLRGLLADSSSVSRAELLEQIREHGLELDPDSSMLVAILSIDHYRQFEQTASKAEKRLYAFAVMNIAGEVISRRYRCESVDMRSGHFVMIISGFQPEGFGEKIGESMREIIGIVEAYYRVSLSVALGPIFKSHEDMSKSYELAQQVLEYRMVYGPRSIISYEMVKARLDNRDFTLPPELEKKLAEAIKSGNASAFGETIQKLFQFMGRLHPDNIYHAVLLVLTAVKQAVGEMNVNKLKPVSVDWNHLQKQLLEKETLDSMAEELTVLFRELQQQQEDGDAGKNRILFDTIKEYIEDRYEDPNLSLQGIASMLKMSSAHVGKLFKQSEGMSVAEYITEIRLAHTVRLLETTDRSVSEVMERVGFINRSNFYKLFKSKFGVTPNEYRLKKVIY